MALSNTSPKSKYINCSKAHRANASWKLNQYYWHLRQKAENCHANCLTRPIAKFTEVTKSKYSVQGLSNE